MKINDFKILSLTGFILFLGIIAWIKILFF